MPQSLADLNIHIIFSTKNRQPLILPDVADRLYSYMGGIIRPHRSVLLAAGGVADHVHLLVSLARDLSVSDLLRLIKTNSSVWIHDTFPALAHFGWQDGYGAFSVSHSQIELVRAYIAGQAEHHRTRTFQDEFREFLKRHGIEYDERYVWD